MARAGAHKVSYKRDCDSLRIKPALLAVSTTALLAMTLAGWMPLPFVASLLMAAAFAFGLVTPNAMNGTMQPSPLIAGAAGAAGGSIQILAGAGSSGLVAILFDGHSALSMTVVMALSSVLALVSYLLVARPAECLAQISSLETSAAPIKRQKIRDGLQRASVESRAELGIRLDPARGSLYLETAETAPCARPQNLQLHNFIVDGWHFDEAAACG